MSQSASRYPFILLVIAVVISVPLVLGFIGGLSPAFDTLALFRGHLAVLLVLLGLPLLFTPLRREGAMIVLFALLALGTTLSATRNLMGEAKSAASAANTQTGARYSLVQINLGGSSTDHKRIMQMIAREKPDFIAYQGADPSWDKWLTILGGSYHYHVDCHNNRIRTGILSRRPFSEGGEPVCDTDGRYAASRFDLGGTPVTVASIALDWPWPGRQSEILQAIAPHLRQISGPAILAGDFKAAPWSRVLRQIAHETGTRLMEKDGGTWLPRPLPDSFAPVSGLAIDHVLVSQQIEAPHIWLRAAAGSSHLPVRLDFSVAPPSPQEEEEADSTTAMLQ